MPRALRRTIPSLLVVLLGTAAAYPTLARSKGQLCNSPGEEGRRVELALTKVSVDGVDFPPPDTADAGFLLKTEFDGVEGVIHASVLAPDGGVRVVHAQRQP